MSRPKRGEVWYYQPSYTLPGNLYNKERPVVIVGDDALNSTSEVILVVPCTKQTKKKMESHANFNMSRRVNTAMAEQARPVLLTDLVNYKRTLDEDEMLRVDIALINAYGLQKYIKEDYMYAAGKSKSPSRNGVHKQYCRKD